LHKEQVTKKMHPSFRLFPELLGLPKTPVNPALLGAADGDPEHHATATSRELKKKNLVFESSKLR